MKAFMHITYLEAPGRMADAFALADEIRFGGIELRGFDEYGEMSDEKYVARVGQIAARRPNLIITFNFDGDFTNPDKPARIASQKRIAEQIERFKDAVGIEFINLRPGWITDPKGKIAVPDECGSNIAEKWQWDAVAEHTGELSCVAAKLGMHIALETHHGLLCDTPQTTCKLLDEIGCYNVGANFDFGNMIMHGDTPPLAESLEMLKDRIIYFHLKNTTRCPDGWVQTLLSSGDIDHDEYLRIISTWDHVENLALEFPRAGDGVYACGQDMAYLRGKAERFGMEIQ